MPCETFTILQLRKQTRVSFSAIHSLFVTYNIIFQNTSASLLHLYRSYFTPLNSKYAKNQKPPTHVKFGEIHKMQPYVLFNPSPVYLHIYMPMLT